MSPAPGTQLGPLTLRPPLGAGSRGEVHRAVVPALILGAACCLTACGGGSSRQEGAALPADSSLAAGLDSSAVRIQGPTLLAVVPYRMSYLDSNLTNASDDTTGLATMLDDFSFYLAVTDSALHARGVERHFRVGTVVHWVESGRVDSMALDPEQGVAYLLRTRAGLRIHRGVATDVDLLAFVDSALAAGDGR